MPINPNPPFRNADGSVVPPSEPIPQQNNAGVSSQHGDGTWRYPNNQIDYRPRNADGTLVDMPDPNSVPSRASAPSTQFPVNPNTDSTQSPDAAKMTQGGSTRGQDGVWRFPDGSVDNRARQTDGSLVMSRELVAAQGLHHEEASKRQPDGTWRFPDGSVDNRPRGQDGAPYVYDTQNVTDAGGSTKGSDGVWRYPSGQADVRPRNADGSLQQSPAKDSGEKHPETGPMRGEPSFGTEPRASAQAPAKPPGPDSGVPSEQQEDGSWKYPDGSVDRRERNSKGELIVANAQPLSATPVVGDSIKQADGSWKFPNGLPDQRERDADGNLKSSPNKQGSR